MRKGSFVIFRLPAQNSSTDSTKQCMYERERGNTKCFTRTTEDENKSYFYPLRLLALLRTQDSHRSVDTCNDEFLSILAPIDSSQHITVLLTLDQ